MKFEIITPVFNKSNFTKQYLDCMKALPPDKFEIVIVDNKSTDNTLQIVNEYLLFMDGIGYPKLHLERLDENLGFAKASNIGWSKHHNCNAQIFLNNDIKTINNTWYVNLEKTILEKDKVIVGPTGGYVNNGNFVYETNNHNRAYNYISGWCLAAYTSTFELLKNNTPDSPVGPFIEKFGTYFEDTYMGYLCNRLDVKMEIVQCDIVHFGKITSSQLNTYALYSKAKELFLKEVK